jgi:hypothetical protein
MCASTYLIGAETVGYLVENKHRFFTNEGHLQLSFRNQGQILHINKVVIILDHTLFTKREHLLQCFHLDHVVEGIGYLDLCIERQQLSIFH